MPIQLESDELIFYKSIVLQFSLLLVTLDRRNMQGGADVNSKSITNKTG